MRESWWMCLVYVSYEYSCSAFHVALKDNLLFGFSICRNKLSPSRRMCHHTTFPSHTFTSVPGAKSVTRPDRFVGSQPLGCQIQSKCPVRQWSRRAPEGIKSSAAWENLKALRLSSRPHPLRTYMDWRHLRDGQPNTFPSDLGRPCNEINSNHFGLVLSFNPYCNHCVEHQLA